MADKVQAGTTEGQGSPSPAKAKTLSRRFILPRIGSKEKMVAKELTEDMVNLQIVCRDRLMRNALIAKLLPENPQLSVKVRFCTAVEDYESLKDKVEKKQKARKIITSFVHSGSIFQINNFPSELEAALLADKLEVLEEAKIFFLEELTRTDLVRKELREILPQIQEMTIDTSKPTQHNGEDGNLNVLSPTFYDTVISPPPSPLTPSKPKLDADSSPRMVGGCLPLLSSREVVIEELPQEVQDLQKVLDDRLTRHSLIMRLLPDNVPLSVAVRFCSAVTEHEIIAERVEKKAKARKIVGIFVHNGSMFQMAGIPEDIKQELFEDDFSRLIELKRIKMIELSTAPPVKKIVDELLKTLA